MPKYIVTAEIVVCVDAEDEYKAQDMAFDLMEWGNADFSVEEEDDA